MGVTSRYEIPYPEPTDPVAAGAAAIRSLAEAVDRTLPPLLYQSTPLPDINATGTGIKNVGTVTQTFTVPVICEVAAYLYAGFGSGQLNLAADIFGTAANAVQMQAPGPVAAPAGAYVPLPLGAMFAVAAGAAAGLTVRVNLLAGTGNLHTAGLVVVKWWAAP